MYSTDLSKISLEAFERVLRTSQLLPTQQPVLVKLNENIQALEKAGIDNLLKLQAFLKTKSKYPQIQKSTGINEEALILINRMANSFVVKQTLLDKLGIFHCEELSALATLKIKNTKQLYDMVCNEMDINKIVDETGIPADKLDYALRITDLLRINGVGVDYAKLLYKMGIKCVSDYKNTDSEKILAEFEKLNENYKYTRATLGIKDIDYCRRFCNILDCDLF